MKYSKLIAFALLSILVLTSCGTASKLGKANAIYDAGGYYKAAELYRKLSSKVDTEERVMVNFRLGECYRILNNTVPAERAYNRVIINRSNHIPEAYLRYGEVLLMNKKYDEAIQAFTEYKSLVPDDDRVDKGIVSSQMAKEQIDKNADYIIENFKEINSAQNDYAPAFGTADHEMILYTSSRNTGGRLKKRQAGKRQAGTGQRPSSIFYTIQSRTGWERPRVLGEGVNGKFDEDGACCFDESFGELYFTKSIPGAYNFEGCTIYVAKRDNSYNWTDAEPLGVNDSIVMAHPGISRNGLTLYFVSNMPGGFGGNDIWKMTRKTSNGTWEELINLGSQINTRGDELFPFIRGNGELYFASNGHPGYGGLDLYKATPVGAGSWEVENMGPHFNSELDDFALIYEDNSDRGYFSSRRKGGRGGDDIYRFYKDIPVIEYYVNGIVLSEETKRPISGVQVKLTGSNGATLIKNTEANGRYEFKLNPNTDYIAIATVPGCLNQKSLFSTVDLTDSYTFQDTMMMVSTAKPIEIPNIFYEYGSAALNPESRAALDELVEIMVDNPDIVVELAAHTDSRGTEQVNIDLSQRRAQAVVDYLIHEGVDEGRMYAVGYGFSEPKVVDRAITDKYPFLRVGAHLTDTYINTLRSEEEKEIAHQLNRRTELEVLNR
jgi:peptidoglycan-associated lipoprotein